MTSPIDPIRRSYGVGRVQRTAEVGAAREAEEAKAANLPVPVQPVRPASPREDPVDPEAAFAAQLMGQKGERRGLRAGPRHIESAKDTYNKTEWSGAKDRRAPRGGRTDTGA
jgi:hypothetical protein